jgi:predicted transcriptional regulator
MEVMKNNKYSNEFKRELDSRYKEYINNGKLICEENANERITKIINTEQYNKEIEDAEKEIEKGEFYTHEEVKSMSAKWIQKSSKNNQ